MKTAACVVVFIVVVVPWSQGHLSVNALCGLPSRVYRTTSPTLSFPLPLFAYLWKLFCSPRALLCFKFFIRHSECERRDQRIRIRNSSYSSAYPILSYNFLNLPSCKLHSFVIALPPKLFRFNILQGTVSRAVFGFKSTQKMINVGQCLLIRYLTCI